MVDLSIVLATQKDSEMFFLCPGCDMIVTSDLHGIPTDTPELVYIPQTLPSGKHTKKLLKPWP
jgi:hypothetical protein